MDRPCSTYGEVRKCIQNFVGKSERDRVLRRLGRRLEDNINLISRKLFLKLWTRSIWVEEDHRQSLMNTVINLRIHKKGSFSTNGTTIRFSRKTLFHGVSLRIHKNMLFLIT